MSTKLSVRLCLVLLSLASRWVAGAHDDGGPSHLLPRDTRPVAYGLRLVPSYDKGSNVYGFGGQVEILIAVDRITPNVVLNAKDMQIKSVAITELKTQTDLTVDGYEMIADGERLMIYAAKNLLAGRQYQVKIVFQGYLRTDMTGFYRSAYKENDNTKWLAVSQFKPTYARRAFPCYDEPAYKTPFNVSLGRQEYQMSLSNMPRYLTQRLEYYGWWADHFETTPPISTYQVGVFVGVLKKSPQIKGNDLNIYTSKDYLMQTGYVMEETPTLIETMENYTDSSNELKKLDFIAIPDFSTDGMENWGINTYRERYILLDDDPKTKFKEQSTMVVQQSLSRQWFGNLVTCSWWDFLWLNEGFSRYFQYFATATIKPNWRMEELFVVEQHQTALTFDQIPRHPVTASVKTSEDIQSIIDPVTYNKAAAILRMIKHTVSENRFQEPLKLYIENSKYGSASPSILWSVFENYYFENGFELQEDVSFTNYALSWTDQSGYPVINVTSGVNSYTITQQKFSIWPCNDTTTQWYIPLTYTNDLKKDFEDLNPVRWMKPSTSVMYIRDSSLSSWVIFNLQSSGFYRVNYDTELWTQLIKQLNVSHGDIHVLNRAQLIDDSFNLARAGMLDYYVAFNISTYLQSEDDYIPWYTAIECLSYVLERMRRSAEGYSYIKSYVRNLAELIYQKTEVSISQYHNNDHMTKTSWNKFSVWACNVDSENCTRNALGNFKKWTMGQNISADIKDAALCTGIKLSNGTETWRGVLNVYVTSKSASEKNSAQTALTCTRDTMILYKYLDFLFDSDNGGPIRLQDFKDICDAMSLTPQGIEALTNFLMNNIERMLRTIPTGESLVTYMYRLLASKVALDTEIIKLYNLKNAVGLPLNIKKSFDESYVFAEQNLHWYNSYHVRINQWMGAPMDMTTTEPVTSTETTTTPSTTTSPSTTKSPSTTTQTTTSTTTQTTTSTSTTSSDSTSAATVSQENTSSTATASQENTSPTATSPSENSTTSTTTSSQAGNGTTETVQSTTTRHTFDFDNPTPGTISRCPSGALAHRQLSAPVLVVITAVYVLLKTVITF